MARRISSSQLQSQARQAQSRMRAAQRRLESQLRKAEQDLNRATDKLAREGTLCQCLNCGDTHAIDRRFRKSYVWTCRCGTKHPIRIV